MNFTFSLFISLISIVFLSTLGEGNEPPQCPSIFTEHCWYQADQDSCEAVFTCEGGYPAACNWNAYTETCGISHYCSGEKSEEICQSDGNGFKSQ